MADNGDIVDTLPTSTEVNGKPTAENLDLPANTRVIPARVPLDDFLASATLIDAIRRRVLEELHVNDYSRLADVVYGKVIEKLDAQNEVRKLVDSEVGRRLKVMGTIATVLLGIVGFLGFRTFASMMETTAQDRAERAVNAKMDKFEHQEDLEADRVAKRVDKIVTDAAADEQRRREAFAKDLESQSDRLEKKLAKAQGDTEAALLTLQQALMKYREDAERTASAQTAAVEKNAADASANARAVLDKATKESVEQGVKQIEISAQQAINEITKAKRAFVTGDAAQSTRDPDDKHDGQTFKYEVKAFEILTRRHVPDLLPMAKDMMKQRAFDAATALLQPILMEPDRFTEGDLQEAVKLLTDERIDTLDRRGEAGEVVIAAVLAGNEAAYKVGRESLQANVLNQVEESDLVLFASAIHDKRPRDELQKKFLAISLDNLTTRGLANLLLLAKKAQMPAEVARTVEAALCKAVLESEGKLHEYFGAYFTAKALTQSPTYDRQSVDAALQKIAAEEIQGPNANNDPWKLGERIDGWRTGKP